MSTVWEEVWDSINGYFSGLAAVLLGCNPNLWWTCGHSENEAYPFRAYASFNRRGVPGEEDIVTFLNFARDERGLVFSADISRGDGEVLVDAPGSRVEPATDTGPIRQWILGAASDAIGFFEANESLLTHELCDGST